MGNDVACVAKQRIRRVLTEERLYYSVEESD